MTAKYDVAIVGATGLVGETFLEILAEREFPVGTIYPLASKRSAGNTVDFKNKALFVEDVDGFDFSKTQFAFFSAGADVAAKYGPIAAEQGCVVIDNSSCFRGDEDIPLVVPEVNADLLENFRTRNIIANPNCVAIPLTVALKPLRDAAGIARVNVVSFQSVSGAGKDAIEELSTQTQQLMSGQKIEPKVFPKRIAFNVIPQCDSFADNGYTLEEMKIINETKKILNDDFMMVNPTAVRVPVFFGHSIAAHVEFEQRMDLEQVKDLLRAAPGIILMEDDQYPTPEDLKTDGVYVGRVRKDISHTSGFNFWIVADNIRKGAALNAIEIAELILNRYYN